MTPTLFNINFRRSSYEQAQARARRRVISLGLWVAYGGFLVILFGLFTLNCVMMSGRTATLERGIRRLESLREESPDLRLDPSDVELVQRVASSPGMWRDRLVRLSEILPATARVSSLTANPERSAAPAEQRRLVISGTLRASAETDRMQAVVRLVETLRSDSSFARGYQNIKLVSSRVPDTEGTPLVEFVVECR